MFILSSGDHGDHHETTRPMSDGNTQDHTQDGGPFGREPADSKRDRDWVLALGSALQHRNFKTNVPLIPHPNVMLHFLTGIQSEMIERADRAAGVTQAERIDAAGHTVCELDRSDYKVLLQLATCDRAALLAERRQYVIARRGDQTRFVELIKTLDRKIEAATALTDKLARLYAVKS